MPRLTPEMYDAQNQTVLSLAARPSVGVSRNEIMNSIRCSRPRAEKLVNTLDLVRIRRDGRTSYFGPPGSTPWVGQDEPEDNVIEVLPSEPVMIAAVTPTATATAVALAPAATAVVSKPAVKTVNPEITLLENRARKLAAELEIVRTKLISAQLRA